MKLPGLKWFLPSHYEVRHPLKWMNRVIHCRTVYPFGTDLFFTGVDLSHGIADIQWNPQDFQDFKFVSIGPKMIDRLDGSPWLLGGDHHYRYTHTSQWSTWQLTCVYSECCDAPVYRRTSFIQMRAFHWCPKCETLLTTVDIEDIIHFMFEYGESFVDNDFYV